MTRKWLAALAAGPLLFLAHPAAAQGLGGFGERSETGTIHGIVEHLSYPRGLLSISTSRGVFMIHATPDQLTDYRLGDRVDVDYDDYAGVRWISGGGGGAGGPGEGTYAVSGTASGVVSRVDAARGTVTLGGAAGRRLYHAHPDDLQDVVPGQFVSLDFERIGNARWIEDVEQGGR